MHTPKEIPEAEVPWEFLVDAPERRSRDRRVNPECDDICERVVGVERRMAILANEFYSHRRLCVESTKEAEAERAKIIEKLDKIDSHLDRQKGFFAGAVWLGSAMIAFIATVVGLAINYFKE